MGLKLDKPIEWDSKLSLAAVLVAEGQLTYKQIGALVNRSEQTISGWLTHPEFKARVDHTKRALAMETTEAVMTLAVSNRQDRINRLDEDWKRLQQVREARAKSELYTEAEIPGINTGLIVVKETSGGTPEAPWRRIEHQIDSGYLAEMRNIETQAAKELGQNIDPGTTINVKLYGGFNPDDV